MFAGRGYSTWIKRGLVSKDPLDDLSTEQLLKHLVTWSTPLRIRVAKALTRKDEDVIPALSRMLESDDRETILAGVYGLEEQGLKAEPALDKLVGLLSHDDLWIRFRAGATLCS